MKFTVIIPTRERSDTLYYSLKTCVTQDYDDLEILVSDNFSQDNTREIVDSFKDKRIRYINTSKRVSMSENWEFALSHVKDGYVTVLGDDDGILPSSIVNIAETLRTYPTRVLAWSKANYYWPGYVDSSLSNRLRINSGAGTLLVVPRSTAIRASENLFISSVTCPNPYTAVVHITSINNIRGNNTHFIHDMSPDIYTGFAIMSLENQWLFSQNHFSISGASRHSIGHSYSLLGITKLMREFFDENITLPTHPRVQLIERVPILGLAGALFEANDHCFHGSLNINVKRLLRLTFKKIRNFPIQDYQQALNVGRKVAQSNGLGWYWDLLSHLYGQHIETTGQIKRNPDANTNYIDATKFGVSDIYGATLLAHKLLPDYKLPCSVKTLSYPILIASKVWRKLTHQVNFLANQYTT